MLTTDLEDLFAMIPRAESKLSHATPRSPLEPILSGSEEDLAEPVNFQSMVGEGEPEWDECHECKFCSPRFHKLVKVFET